MAIPMGGANRSGPVVAGQTDFERTHPNHGRTSTTFTTNECFKLINAIVTIQGAFMGLPPSAAIQAATKLTPFGCLSATLPLPIQAALSLPSSNAERVAILGNRTLPLLPPKLPILHGGIPQMNEQKCRQVREAQENGQDRRDHEAIKRNLFQAG